MSAFNQVAKLLVDFCYKEGRQHLYKNLMLQRSRKGIAARKVEVCDIAAQYLAIRCWRRDDKGARPLKLCFTVSINNPGYEF